MALLNSPKSPKASETEVRSLRISGAYIYAEVSENFLGDGDRNRFRRVDGVDPELHGITGDRYPRQKRSRRPHHAPQTYVLTLVDPLFSRFPIGNGGGSCLRQHPSGGHQ